ncbi:hypothetical protein T492DRAFT_969555 [Pavlovales sp. CCMP2436]|nr:hypothetical protein T492DRAFT_969555 [Pavlovales sp. CCMP2436]
MLYRDPVFVPESGNTYDRAALETFWRQTAGRRARDPLTNRDLSTRQVFVNWDKRREVASWLSEHVAVTPTGWASRDDIPPAVGTRQSPPGRGWWRLPGWPLPGVSARGLALVLVVAISFGFGASSGWRESRWHQGYISWHAPGPHDAQPLWALTAAVDGADISDGAPDALVRHQQPLGSRLAVRERVGPPKLLSVYTSRVGVGELRLAPLAQATFTLGFTLVWTLGTMQGGAPLFFVLFSAPFWWVGAQLLGTALAPLLEATGLELKADGLEVRSEPIGRGPRMLRLRYAEVQDIRLTVSAVLNDSPELVLVIVAGLETVQWGFGLAPAELQWVCRLARTFLADLEILRPDAPAAASPPGSTPRPEQPPGRLRPELAVDCEYPRRPYIPPILYAHPMNRGGVGFDVGFGF